MTQPKYISFYNFHVNNNGHKKIVLNDCLVVGGWLSDAIIDINNIKSRKGSNSRISRIAQMNMNLLVIWYILSREISNEDMELKLEI